MPYQYLRLFIERIRFIKIIIIIVMIRKIPQRHLVKKHEIDRELPDISKNVSLELTLAMDNGGNNKLLEQD